MRRIIITLFAAAAALGSIASCAKVENKTSNDPELEYLEAWIGINHPGVTKTGKGIYILEETEGTGEALTSSKMEKSYGFVQYTTSELDGTITQTYFEEVAKRIGDYNAKSFYGSIPWPLSRKKMIEGLHEALEGMKVGGTRKVLIPGWLTVYKEYKSAKDYLEKESGQTVIYDIHLTGITDNITKWQIDSIERFNARTFGQLDSTKYGHYYRTLIEPVDTTSLPNDTTIYINYIGRLLDGRVFDTNIEDTAKVHNIYSKSRSYTPSKIEMAEEVDNIQFDGSKGAITGFKYTFKKMKPFEKGRAVFISDLGYGAQGSEPTIPPYSPLIFDIELVDAPDNS